MIDILAIAAVTYLILKPITLALKANISE